MHAGALSRIHVFERDPTLLDGLPDAAADVLRRRVLVPCEWTPVGPLEPPPAESLRPGHLGLLVLDGLLVRTVGHGGRACSEVVGPGDLLRACDGADTWPSVACAGSWQVLRPAVFAHLDADFAEQAGRFPTVIAQLLSRTTGRTERAMHQAAIAQVRHAETRILLALWSFADRWGCVTPQGVQVPVPLTHRLLSQITCLQRPTVSSAVRALTLNGILSRSADRGWVLHGGPPSPGAMPGGVAGEKVEDLHVRFGSRGTATAGIGHAP